MPNSGYWREPEPWGKSCFWIVEWKVPEEALKACVPFLLPSLPCPLDTSPFLQHHSGESALIRRWRTLRKKAEVGTPTPGDVEPRAFCSSSPEAPHPLGAVAAVSLQEDLLDLEVVGSGQRGAGSPGPWGRLIGWHTLPSPSAP